MAAVHWRPETFLPLFTEEKRSFKPNGCQSFRRLAGRQFLDELINVAIHDRRQVVRREVDAVIGNSGLWVVVGADFLGALGSADLLTALLVDLGAAFLLLHLVEACP